MKISKDARRTARQMLAAVVVHGKVDAGRAKAFAGKIVELKPRGYLQILSAFTHLLRLEMAKRHAVVESAVALEPDVRSSVEADLKKKYGDDLTFDFQVDPDLLGGMRVKVGSDVWDGSVRSRLTRLREAFL